MFCVRVAGAALTDLTLGTQQYVERGMRSPEENVEGYEKGKLSNYIDRLEGKLLLYLGTGDQNAVGVNAEQLIDALVKAGKPFDMMSYPEGQQCNARDTLSTRDDEATCVLP